MDALAEIKPQAEPKEPVAQPVPSTDDEKSVQGLSRAVTKWREKALAAEKELAKVRGNQGEQADRQNIIQAVTEEITKVEDAHDWKGDALRLAKELKAAQVVQKYGNDSLLSDLIKRGLPVENVDDEFYELLRRVRDDDGEPVTPHNPLNRGRSMSREQQDELILRTAGASILFP